MKKRYLIPGLMAGYVFWAAWAGAWTVVDTGQDRCYSTSSIMACPGEGQAFSGQDAQYQGHAASYQDNRDGTVTDLVTGLMWSKAVDARKANLIEARQAAQKMTLGGHTDWRVPNIKALYSLMDFRGNTGSHQRANYHTGIPSDAVPYINTDYFDFRYGDLSAGERYIDAQWLSSTEYVSTTMDGAKTLFGVNFADGRIKGYAYLLPGPFTREKKFYVRYVRGPAYGTNDFKDNGNGTVNDRATGLVWMQTDSRKAMGWQDALAYAEKMVYAGHTDWRLPDAKELQSIVDYTRSPDTTDSAAIDPVFKSTPIKNEAGHKDFGFYWTSTTHLEGQRPDRAVYIAFGRGMGMMHNDIMDVHGAGAQRSDPKTGQARLGMGPQGDAQRVLNFVRLVRGGGVIKGGVSPSIDRLLYPTHIRIVGENQPSNQSFHSSPKGGPSPMGGSPPPGKSGHGSHFINHSAGSGPDGRPPGGALFIQRLDRDHDGKVSLNEFDGPKDHFSDFDVNHDGYISSDEAPSGPPPRSVP